MAYHGYASLVKGFISQLPPKHVPSVLEVGIDRGVMLIPLVAFLARTREVFAVIGVDIMVQEQVQIMLANLDLRPTQHAHCVEANSLETLPKMIDQGMKFDVILLDGDHNYHTVAEELKHLDALTHQHSIVIIDDYDGRWAEKDLWYADRPGYEEVKIATPQVGTDKHGVKPAVDEWLSAHPEWHKSKPVQGEPILLMRQPI